MFSINPPDLINHLNRTTERPIDRRKHNITSAGDGIASVSKEQSMRRTLKNTILLLSGHRSEGEFVWTNIFQFTFNFINQLVWRELGTQRVHFRTETAAHHKQAITNVDHWLMGPAAGW